MNVGRHYNFSVYANSILGSSYRNAKLLSTLTYELAKKFDNVDMKHRMVYPYLPPNTLNDLTKYTYYLFKVNGKELLFADVWIINGSVEETLGLNYNLKLNNITEGQLAMIRDQLRLIGINFTID